MTQEITAIIQVNPQINQAIIALHNEALKLLEYAETAVIKTDEDVKARTEDLVIISGLKKSIEEKRKEYVGPINDHLKRVNDAFKDFTAPLIQADTISREKVKEYRRQEEAIQAEQERINQMRIDAASAEMKLKGELTESVNLIEVQPEPAKHYRAGGGMSGMVDHWKCEVIDFNLLPNEYKITDMVRLNKVVRAGARDIPGVRIWNDPDIRVTTTKEV